MNHIKEKIEDGKVDASKWYGVGSRWFTMGNIFLYLAACIVAGGLVGPVRYVEFLYHCSHFEHPAQATAPASKPNTGDEVLPILPAPADRPGAHKQPVYRPESSF